eukprot:634154_1
MSPQQTQILRLMVYISVIYIKVSQTSWIVANEPLPQSMDGMAVGEYNGKIYLIGSIAFDFPKSLVEIDINTQGVTNLGRQFFSVDTSVGEGQAWTQQAHVVYFIGDTSPSTFHTFDLITKQYTTNWQGITFNTDVGSDSCLASTEAFLYVVGGADTQGDAIDTVQMLSLTTFAWMNDPSPLQVGRENHACIVHNNYLWVFGGQKAPSKDNIEVATNERIQTINIAQNTWQFIGSFSIGLEYIRVASRHDVIYVVGGADVEDHVHDWVHLVDANTGSITVSSDTLPWSNIGGSPIIVDDIFYVFGGFYEGSMQPDPSNRQSQWAYYTLPTPYPTEMPSHNPTVIPTQNPTKLPTIMPSYNPTKLPTQMTTDEPTKLPTNLPTKLSTNMPTNVPTNTPTNIPTNIPSIIAYMTTNYFLISIETPLMSQTMTTSKPIESKPIDISGTILIVFVSALMIALILYLRKKHKAKSSEKHVKTSISTATNGDIMMNVLESGQLEDDSYDEGVDFEGMYDSMPKQMIGTTIATNGDTMMTQQITIRRQGEKDDVFKAEQANSLQIEGGGSLPPLPRETPEDVQIVLRARKQINGNESGICTDCTCYGIGLVYEGDGLFYCNQCWSIYE